MKKDDELDPLLRKVAREKGTEAPFSGKYVDEKSDGIYACAVCGNQLFLSDTKFDPKLPGLQGWPSFDQAIPGSVALSADDSDGMHRTEVTCKRCGAHLGHLFSDTADAKTGRHYCINSVCLELKKNK